MRELKIIKIGGNLLDDPVQLTSALTSFARLRGPKLLVHGGGKKSSELSKKMGITPQMVDGRRITDRQTLEIVVMVYAGWLNKSVVSELQALGCQAIGLSGADGNAIRATKREAGTIDFGFAGDIQTINVPFLETLLHNGLTPVCCAITHDGRGQLLNTNADTIATELAGALSEKFRVTLQFIFEKNGVLVQPQDDASFLSSLSKKEYQALKEQGIVTGGMIPKLDNAFLAKKANVHQVFIGGPSGIDETATFKGTEICD